MYGIIIYLHEWLKLMVSVGKYTMQEAFGYYCGCVIFAGLFLNMKNVHFKWWRDANKFPCHMEIPIPVGSVNPSWKSMLVKLDQ